MRDKSWEVEDGVLRVRARLEERLILLVARSKTLHELRPDFIVVLPDQRADGCHDLRSAGAVLLHGRDRGLDNSMKGAAPSGVCCRDHTCAGIRQEERAAVGSGYSDRNTAARGDQRVGLWTLFPRPGLLDQDRSGR